MADFSLDNRFPILLFPLRIETKYHPSSDGENWKLRLRFFPDQIAIDNFETRLTIKEIEDARNYWRIIANANEEEDLVEVRNAEWCKLANKYGLPRTAYITKEVINYDPDNEPDPHKPILKDDQQIPVREENEQTVSFSNIMPTLFFIYAKFKDGTPTLEPLDILIQRDKEPLVVDPFQLITDADKPNWITNFEMARDIGMAFETETTLSRTQYERGFEFIIVYGVKTDHTPDGIKQQVEQLFKSHRYTSGFSFIKQGTPTNLVKQKSSNAQPTPSSSPFGEERDVMIKYRSTEFSGFPPDFKLQLKSGEVFLPHDGKVFAEALGIERVVQGAANSNHWDHIIAPCMSSLLWPMVGGYFLETFTTLSEENKISLMEHFIKYVSGQGSIPPIRVGNIPYGVLPVTISSEWQDNILFQNTDLFRKFLTNLMDSMLDKFLENVPTVMKKSHQIPPDENLLNILSMEPVSNEYFVRGIRLLQYVTDLIYAVLRERLPNNEPKITYQRFPQNRDIRLKNEEESVARLGKTLGVNLQTLRDLFSIAEKMKIMDLCLGRGITRLNFPLISKEKDLPSYLDDILTDIKEGGTENFFKTTVEQIGIPGVEPSSSDPLLLRLLRYCASIVGNSSNSFFFRDLFRESLENLLLVRNKFDKFVFTEILKDVMLQTLDLSSYRLDAWISSFANQRLDHLRKNNSNGLHLGAFGWIENLMPKEFEAGISTKNPIPQGGYIHAPSYAHAAAAAVLRNGYLTHSNESDKKDLLKINLNSERTKNALEIINDIQRMPLSELLGYRLERRLHDANIDYLIDEFRNFFPLNKDDPVELEEEDDDDDGQPVEAKERIEPRNLTDGLTVYKNWKRLNDSISLSNIENIKDFMATDTQKGGWKPFYKRVKLRYASTEEKIKEIIGSLKPHLDYLLDEIDGLSDLSVAESVYQAVNGNYSRSSAVMDGMSADGQIPIPEISSTPRSGPNQLQRIVLALGVEALETLILRNIDDENAPESNPRKVAEPNFGQLCESYIGDVSFWLEIKDETDNIISTEKLGLDELDLEALDLLYIQNSELEMRLKYYGKKRGHDKFDIRYEKSQPIEDEEEDDDATETKSFSDLEFLIKSLQETIAQGQPLRYSDFISPQQTVKEEVLVDSVKEVFQRYYDILVLFVKTIRELESVVYNNDETEEQALENKRTALIKASLFGIEFAIPIDTNGNIITSKEELNSKITITVRELKSRVPQYDSLVQTLLEWKSIHETQGEEALLESVSNRLSGGSDNEKKYYKTLEIMITHFRRILNNSSFLVLAPFTNPSDFLANLSSSVALNRKVLKWIEKAAYVRPRLKLFDDIVTYNQIFESAYFSFYCDERKFMQSAETLSSSLDNNLTSTVVVLSTKTGEPESLLSSDPSKKLIGLVIDEWTDKIVSKTQDTAISFHYDGPSTEAPQTLLLAVSPNNSHIWNKNTLRTVIQETLMLAKLRAIDYRSLKELRQFFPLPNLNSHGGDIYINLYEREGGEGPG